MARSSADGYYFHEDGQNQFFNAWTLVHFSVGVLSWTVLRSEAVGLALHTVYEGVEGNFFPSDHRDRSMKNHVGDTIAFLGGSLLARLVGVGVDPAATAVEVRR